MKKCISCESQLKPNAKFCNGCGAKVELPPPAAEAASPADLSQSAPSALCCPSCGNDNNAGAKFCRHCGSAMDGSVPASTAAKSPPEAAFDTAEEHDWSAAPQIWKRSWFIAALLALIVAAGGGAWYMLKQPATLSCAGSDASTRPECAQVAEAAVTGENQDMYIVADANVRDQATAIGSKIITKLLRGAKVSGIMRIGTDGESRWLKLSDGRGFIGAVNLASAEPPKLSTLFIDRQWDPPNDIRLLATPDESGAVIETLPSGTTVFLAGLTEDGFVEVKRPKGGVGYLLVSEANDTTGALSAGGVFTDSDIVSDSAGADNPFGLAPNSSRDARAVISDQDIHIFMGGTNVFGSPVYGRIFYKNLVTGRSCSSHLVFEGYDDSQSPVFLQIPKDEDKPCDASPKVSITMTTNNVYAAWFIKDKTVMSGELKY